MPKPFIIAVVSLILMTALAGCNSESTDPESTTLGQMPSDFNFALDYGIGGKNNVDTYNGTFTKDLVINGTETIQFVIPADKMQEIYTAFMEYKIPDLPDNINAHVSIEEEMLHIIPANNYAFSYTCNNETRTIICDDGGPWNTSGPSELRDRLVDFVDFVREYIHGTEEYQNMSPSEGGYD
jgi:hypothetical protein